MLKAALVVLVLPPVNLALLALAGLIVARFRRRLGIGIASVAVLGLVLLSWHAVTTPMLRALETDLPLTPRTNVPPSVIVVLSGDSQGSPSVPGGYAVGVLTLQRLRVAAALHRRTGLPILVTGGPVPREAPPLADLMVRSLREDFRVGTPRFVERKAGDTWENAVFSAEILREAGIGSVYLVTSAWHMRRSVVAFEAAGLLVTAAPTPLTRALELTPSDFIPTIHSWVSVYFAAHEWVGLLWYRWR
jgi:uncharacterized SAM-binding protein YcdF (DUF218 family)